MWEIRFRLQLLKHGIKLVLEDLFVVWLLVPCLVTSLILNYVLMKVLVPVYQSETAPRQIRGALVACYQLFITMGILTSYCINLGTSQVQDQSGSWRGPIACSYLWSGLLGVGYIPFLISNSNGRM